MNSQIRKAILAIALIGAGSISTPIHTSAAKNTLAWLGGITSLFGAAGLLCGESEKPQSDNNIVSTFGSIGGALVCVYAMVKCFNHLN